MLLSKSLVMHSNKKSPAAEMFRMLRTNIINNKLKKDIKVIAVTSAIKGEGKSTISSNLALAFVQTGRKVVLIDADMRGPSIHQIFGANRIGGFTNALHDPSNFKEFVKHLDECGLDIITSGQTMYDPTELLSSKNLPILIDKLKEDYDIIIMDTPPIGIISDAALFSNVADGYMLVIAEGSSTVDQAVKAKKQLDNCGANIIGAVYNKMGSKLGKKNYYYKYYYNLYTYGPLYDKKNKKKKQGKLHPITQDRSDKLSERKR